MLTVRGHKDVFLDIRKEIGGNTYELYVEDACAVRLGWYNKSMMILYFCEKREQNHYFKLIMPFLEKSFLKHHKKNLKKLTRRRYYE